MRPRNAALIGLGMVADTHAHALRDAGAARLHGVMARDADKARAFADRHGQPRVYEDLDALAADEELDFVILLTPPDARQDIIRTLAAAGLPVLMEKPVERDTGRAEAIVTLMDEAGLACGVTLQHRMRPAALDLQARLAAGQLGRIGSVDIRIPWWRDQSYYDSPGRGTYGRDGGGVLITQAIHTLDLALHLCGHVTGVQALTATTRLHELEGEDFATAGLRFASGAVGSVMATTAQFPGASEEIVINCERASARLAGDHLVLHWRDGRIEEIGGSGTTGGGGADPMAFTHAWHQAVIEDFATALADDRPPAITARSALAVHRLIDAIAASSRQGRQIPLQGALT
ncbi:Gfo/Idh/MocA family protein [Marinibacterium sp. SX1]|uniref:Gfo/Idh/MocA family protein n=1 Tax=Marinibacterium sp. SX1 TaxID=3388424 RepID=UPI003D1720E6